MAKFDKLFTPQKVGTLELPNRLVMLGIGTGFVTDEGVWGSQLEAFLEARATGGVGLIISPFTPCPLEHWLVPALDEDKFIEPLRKLAQKIHTHGSKFVIQLTTDREWSWDRGRKIETISPSGVFKRRGVPTTRPLTIEEIQRITTQFIEAGRRASEAGCDGVELHGGMGYLLNQFISPVTNKRTDEYGGNLENRMRLILDIISGIKNQARKDFCLMCRMSAEEFMEGGLTLNETRENARILEKAGIDCLDVQAGWHESRKPLVQSSIPPGAWVYLAEAIKKEVKIPVIGAYRINRPELAEEIISQGRADLVGMARQLIADPDTPRKAKEGRENEIRPCITCCHCLDRVMTLNSVECSVNPLVGREAEWVMTPVIKSKNITVIGGGPAGMIAASIAARRGHKITLHEKQDKLGGQLNYASVPPYKKEIGDYRKYLETELRLSGAEIKLKSQADLQKEKPDGVVIAIGAQPLVPPIPGADKLITALDVLSGKTTGEKVIIIGGGLIGCEGAEYLAAQGKKVTILEMLDSIGADIGPSTRWVILGRLKTAGIAVETGAKVVTITHNRVTVERGGQEEDFTADSLVLAVGMVSRKETFGDLKALNVHRIGDGVSARRIIQAAQEGTKLGLEI